MNAMNPAESTTVSDDQIKSVTQSLKTTITTSKKFLDAQNIGCRLSHVLVLQFYL